MPAFGQDGVPEIAVGFAYPDEQEPPAESSRADMLEGFRLCLHWLSKARGAHARHIRIEAAQYVFGRSNESVTAAADRLQVSRPHFSKAVSKIRKLTQGGDEATVKMAFS